MTALRKEQDTEESRAYWEASEYLNSLPEWKRDALIKTALKRAPSARIPMHSSKSVEWYTPREIMDAVHAVMGSIELDPASCAEANAIVRAQRYYTREDDGLRQSWASRTLWSNPPYGRGDRNRSNQGIWSAKLLDAYRCGDVGEACLLVNAVPDRSWFKPLWSHAICFLDERLDFVGGEEQSDDSPTHPSCVVHLGESHARFVEVFGRIGHVVLPERVHVNRAQGGLDL